jgi:hypothetical protein
MKQEIVINSNADRWSRTLSDAVFAQLKLSFAENTKVSDCNFKVQRFGIGVTNEYCDMYHTPNDIQIFNVWGGSYARFTVPQVKSVGFLDRNKWVRSKKWTTAYEDDLELEILIPTCEYKLSTREFESLAHKAIKRLKDKPNFWAVIAIRSINPFLDYIEAGINIGYN